MKKSTPKTTPSNALKELKRIGINQKELQFSLSMSSTNLPVSFDFTNIDTPDVMKTFIEQLYAGGVAHGVTLLQSQQRKLLGLQSSQTLS